MKINRENFMACLDKVRCGLSPKGNLEQSTCFVFQDGLLLTFNGEIACSLPSPLKITGAVQAEPLMASLNKLDDEVIEVELVKGELQIKAAKGRRLISVVTDAKIALPLDSLERPKKWTLLPKKFADHLNLVKECAGRDEAQFALTCIHIHPKWIEAYDRYQLCRVSMKVGVTDSVLVRKSSLEQMQSLDMTKFSLTSKWIHFKNRLGLIFSCPRHNEIYPKDLSEHVKKKGQILQLPKSLVQSCELAEVFSIHNTKDNQVQVTISPNRITIKGVGQLGRSVETKKLTNYSGPEISFMISPKLLSGMLKLYGTECEITESFIKVDGGLFTYITSVEAPEETRLKKKRKEKK